MAEGNKQYRTLGVGEVVPRTDKFRVESGQMEIWNEGTIFEYSVDLPHPDMSPRWWIWQDNYWQLQEGPPPFTYLVRGGTDEEALRNVLQKYVD